MIGERGRSIGKIDLRRWMDGWVTKWNKWWKEWRE